LSKQTDNTRGCRQGFRYDVHCNCGHPNAHQSKCLGIARRFPTASYANDTVVFVTATAPSSYQSQRQLSNSCRSISKFATRRANEGISTSWASST
jgi:hypothetical protein